MTDAYRGVDAILEDRLARFRERRDSERAAGEMAARVFAARAGRIAAGVVAAAIGLAMFIVGLTAISSDRACEACTLLLAAGWIAGAAAMAIARAWAFAHTGSALRREPALTGDAAADLARINATDPLGELRACAIAFETKSVAFPLAAISLLAPLTIHGAISLVACVATDTEHATRDFGCWIAESAIFVGLAHMAVLVQVVLWARSLRQRETTRIRNKLHKSWALNLLITTGVALVPGIFVVGNSAMATLALIPPALVLLTGASFLPFTYVATARRLERERAMLML